MDNLPRDKESQYRDLRPVVRHFSTDLPIRAIGYIPVKRDWVRRSFERLCFMFVLKGDGEFRCGERAWTIKAPCVFVGYPDTYMEYGPREEWEEFYLNFVSELVPVLEARNLISRSRPVWQIHEVGPIRRRARELLDALKDVDSFGHVDRIDRLGESLIIESLISDASPPLGEKERAVMAARAYLEQHYREPVDIDRLAADYGFSRSDFRRRWHAMMRLPPARFVAQLRIREACRLLNETACTVAEVAAAVGYSDPLYFSRRFRQMVGEPASVYRGRQPEHGL